MITESTIRSRGLRVVLCDRSRHKIVLLMVRLDCRVVWWVVIDCVEVPEMFRYAVLSQHSCPDPSPACTIAACS
jgi:hypothetical protein